MAKKKENALSYLQMPLPEGQKKGKMTKLDWSGINYRNTKDTGEISKEMNISTHSAPYLTPCSVKMSTKEGMFDTLVEKKGVYVTPRDICYFEGNFVVQGVFEEKISDNGGAETVLKNVYNVYDSNFNLLSETIIEKIPGDYSGAGIVGFRYFGNYTNIASISTGKRLLYFPTNRTTKDSTDIIKAYSQNIPEVVTLKKHFHDAYKKDWSDVTYDIGDYLLENCRKSGVYYLFECAQDKDENGNALFPGPSSESIYEDYNNSICAKTNSPRGGNLEREYFNIQKPYCVKSGKGYNGLEAVEKYKLGAAAEVTAVPEIYYACVAHQRLFGVNNGCVYASGYNDYANWKFDTADEFSTDNAWMSSTQSTNGGNNTGIVAYGGSVLVFKKNAVFEITNTKNPFRINEVFSVGAIDQKGIQVVGNYLIFVSEDSVMLYNGSSLKNIGYKLNIDRVNSVVSGTDGRKFYMSANINDEEGNRLFVYDTMTGLWAEEDMGFETIQRTVSRTDEEGNELKGENGEVLTETITVEKSVEFVGFAKSDVGFFGLSSSAKIYRIDTEDFDHGWFIETDFFTNGTVDIKHIRKLQMLADLAPGSSMKAYIIYDDEKFDPEKSHLIFERENDGERTVKAVIRVLPRRTASYGFKIRIEGVGYAKLYQMELGLTGGGELYAGE